MEQGPIPFRRMVFVCVNTRENGEACCAERGSERILEALKARIRALGLAGLVRVSRSGCQDVCAKGPSVMVFPDGVWYYEVTAEDVERIAERAARGLVPA